MHVTERLACIVGRTWGGITALRLVGTLIVAFGVFVTVQADRATTAAVAAPASSVRSTHTQFYLEKNVGQAPPQVTFLAHTGEGVLYLLGDGGMLMPTATGVSRMVPYGAARAPRPVAAQRLPGLVNYFIGTNPNHWLTNIPTYQRVTYHNVYPGIDLAYHARGARLEYDWVVRPGANPHRIGLMVQGLRGPALGADGSVRLGGSSLVQPRPVLFQRVAGRRHMVHGAYTLAGQRTIRFQVGQYDRSRQLIIDPVIKLVKYLGGSDDDSSEGIQVDKKGNLYVAGYTYSTDFPIRNGTQHVLHGDFDAYVLKLSPGGALLYSTYIGGSRLDEANALAVDSAGRVYVAGYTRSADFPQLPQGSPNTDGTAAAIVFSLTAAGNGLRYSVLYTRGGEAKAHAIAVSSHGDAYAALESGMSTSNPAVTQVMRIDHAGPRGSGTKFSALGSGWKGTPTGIALTANGRVVVTGWTKELSFPLHAAAQPVAGGNMDGFVTELDPSMRNIIFSTYLGGSNADAADAVALDRPGNVYVTGFTESSNFPQTLTFDVQTASSPFVTKLSSDGRIVYSVVIGATVETDSRAIVVSKQGYATIGGGTLGSGVYPTNPIRGQDSYRGGSWDGFVATLGGAGQQILFSSYLGGNGDDYVESLALGGAGNLFVAGYTTSTDFPRTRGSAFNSSGKYDGFLVKIGNH